LGNNAFKTGSACVWDFFKAKGIDTVFGYPGGAVIPLYDEYNIDSRGIQHIRTSHEQGATHAADGYSRSSGKMGVAIVTSGPGATNTVTGIATAFADSIPMIVISGQVSRPLIGRDAFQEIDITSIVMPITKHCAIVKDPEDLPGMLQDAYDIATSGRPGPVLIDIPKDILMGAVPFASPDSLYGKVRKAMDDEAAYHLRELGAASEADHYLIKDLVDMIGEAKRPIIYAGGGVKLSNSSEELVELAEKNNIPVITTIMGIGNIPGDHALCYGIAGMHGQMQTNMAVDRCDLLIAMGVRFSDRVTGNPKSFAPNARKVHLDIDRSEFNKNVDVTLSIKGCLKDNLKELSSQLAERDRKEWIDEINSLAKFNKSYISDNEPDYRKKIYSVHNIYKALSDHNRGAIVATDVGQHQMWTAQHWTFNGPRELITSGGLGTMGFGLGAAIGAKLGCKDKKTILITGDGSIRMNMNELATIKDYDLDIDVYIIYNGHLGMVRQWQRLFNEERYSETILKDSIDFRKLTEAFGLKYYEVRNMNELMDSIEAKRESHRNGDFTASVTVVRIDEDSGVYPIIPAGQDVRNAIVNISYN
jgi:acetolactate synthase I/II/III large subunit